MITLNIQEATPSRNAVDKMHWARRNRLRGQWQWLVRAAILNDRIKVKRLDRASITIERFGPKLLDHDNFVGGAKQLIDSLKHEGLIKNDDPSHLAATYIQHIGKPSRTLVHIQGIT